MSRVLTSSDNETFIPRRRPIDRRVSRRREARAWRAEASMVEVD